MQKRSASFFAPIIIAAIVGGCASRIQHFTQAIPKQCLRSVEIVDTLDNDITIARPDFGDTVYVIGTVTKPGWTSSKYLARYHSEIGMVSATDDLVDMELWESMLREHISDSLRTATSVGGTTGSGYDVRTGPRGGHFYVNSHGNKTYVKGKK